MIKASVKNSAEDFKTFMKYTSLFINKKIATFIVFEAGAIIALALALLHYLQIHSPSYTIHHLYAFR